MDTEVFFNDYSSVTATTADYGGFLMEDEGFPNFFNGPPTFDSTNFNVNKQCDYQAPNVHELEEFFSSQEFFGEFQATAYSEPQQAVEEVPAIQYAYAGQYEAVSMEDFADSGAASESSTNSSSSVASVASMTNLMEDGEESDDDNDDNDPSSAKKRRQNREAARRYRMKKKSSTRAILEEEKQLERQNAALRQSIDRLEAKLAVIKDVLKSQYGFPADQDILLVQLV